VLTSFAMSWRAFHPSVRSLVLRTGSVALALSLAACGSLSPRAEADNDTVQAVSSLEEHLARAARAEEAGDREKAREHYRTAAKAYPVAEEPWQKLAQSYFNAGDYGNAIQASQEALQRDPKDPTAASMLAISGLRLSSQGMVILRDQAQSSRGRSAGSAQPLTNAPIVVAARLEAETLARELREVLGEPDRTAPQRPRAPATTQPAAVARPAAPTATVAPSAAAPLPTRPTAAGPAAVTARPTVAPATPPVSRPAPAARPAPTSAANPFDKLR